MALFNPYDAFAADLLLTAKSLNIDPKQAGGLNYIYTFRHLPTAAGRLKYHHCFFITHLFSYSSYVAVLHSFNPLRVPAGT